MTKTYRILVTGPRDFPDPQFVTNELALTASEYNGHIVFVHGACPTGVDDITDRWAKEMSEFLDISVEAHPAQNHPTEDFGPWPGAGPRRNTYMTLLGADGCIAFLQECTRPNCRKPRPHNSHGTDSCIRLAEAAGIPVRKCRLG